MSNTKDVIKWTAIYTVLSLIVASAVVFANVVISFGVIASLVLAGLWLGAIGGYIAEDRREEEQTPLAVKVLLATSTLGLLFASSIMFAGGVTITYITAVIGYAGIVLVAVGFGFFVTNVAKQIVTLSKALSRK